MCKILFNQYKPSPFSFFVINFVKKKKHSTIDNNILMEQQNDRDNSNFFQKWFTKVHLNFRYRKIYQIKKKKNINKMYKSTLELSVKIKIYQLKNKYKITSKIMDGLLSSKWMSKIMFCVINKNS
jgi:hypothetical protein